MAGTQLALLVFRLRDSVFQTYSSLAADALVLITVGAAIILSLLHHQRSFRPSTLLSLFLSATAALRIARARTFWLIGSSSGVPAAETAAIILNVISLALESFSKSATRAGEATGASREQLSGFWGSILFAWLAPTLWAGYQKVICVKDLPVLDVQLESHTLHGQLNSTWQTCKYCAKIINVGR